MDPVLALQAKALRAMSADEKLRLADALWIEAREVTAAGVRARHPEWTAEQVSEGVRDLMRDADS